MMAALEGEVIVPGVCPDLYIFRSKLQGLT